MKIVLVILVIIFQAVLAKNLNIKEDYSMAIIDINFVLERKIIYASEILKDNYSRIGYLGYTSPEKFVIYDTIPVIQTFWQRYSLKESKIHKICDFYSSEYDSYIFSVILSGELDSLKHNYGLIDFYFIEDRFDLSSFPEKYQLNAYILNKLGWQTDINIYKIKVGSENDR